MRCLILTLVLSLVLSAGLNSGSQTCPSSGNKLVIAAVTSCPANSCKSSTWTIQAPSGNTGKVYIGGSTVSTSVGVYLNAGDSASMPTLGNATPYDLTQVYIACTVAGDSIIYNYNQ
jgi:hypothetical protein